MRSKTSKQQNTRHLWKAIPGCSEEKLTQTASELARELKQGDRILLEGPMGAGKTAFARALLSALEIRQPPEGSPSFAIAHEYDSPKGGVVHIDFYRLKSEDELEEAGIPAYYWERQLIVLSEWLSSWPELEGQVRQSGRCWELALKYHADEDSLRDLEIYQCF